MPDDLTLTAPVGLKRPGRRLWRAVVAKYVLTAGEVPSRCWPGLPYRRRARPAAWPGRPARSDRVLWTDGSRDDRQRLRAPLSQGPSRNRVARTGSSSTTNRATNVTQVTTAVRCEPRVDGLARAGSVSNRRPGSALSHRYHRASGKAASQGETGVRRLPCPGTLSELGRQPPARSHRRRGLQAVSQLVAVTRNTSALRRPGCAAPTVRIDRVRPSRSRLGRPRHLPLMVRRRTAPASMSNALKLVLHAAAE